MLKIEAPLEMLQWVLTTLSAFKYHIFKPRTKTELASTWPLIFQIRLGGEKHHTRYGILQFKYQLLPRQLHPCLQVSGRTWLQQSKCITKQILGWVYVFKAIYRLIRQSRTVSISDVYVAGRIDLARGNFPKLVFKKLEISLPIQK